MAEALQQLILSELDTNGEIKDTRTITIPGESSPAISQEAQLIIIAALNSLLSREASTSYP